ncbi:MAG: hypothetical protein HZA46_25110 [Planctomycetales bacterium]|nr:hypothetical protein [Planctomycetales bacterium]
MFRRASLMALFVMVAGIGAALLLPPSRIGLAAASSAKTRGGVTPAKADTLLLTYANDPDTINAITANDNVSDAFQRWVYEPLAQSKFENPDILEPVLAEKWTFDEPKLEFTIHLRKGVKWHPMSLPNGKAIAAKEFSARDVKFTFDCILNPGIDAASLRSYYEDPDAKEASQKHKIKVTVIDNYTVKVKWTKPYFMAPEFTLNVPIMPRHVYSVNEKGEPISFDFSSKEFAEGFNNHWANRLMCGTGPMMFVEWAKEEKLVVKRNPDYWGDPFFFETVVFRSIPNTNTSRQEVLQNKLDWVNIPEKDLYLQTKDHASVKTGKVKLAEYEYPGYRYIGYNLRRDFLKDKRVRLALSLAVPVQKIVEEVWLNLAKRTTGPFILGGSAYDTSIEPLPYDLKKAAALLDEAGWKDSDGDGIRDKKINNVSIPARYDIIIFSDAPAYKTMAEIIKESSRQIGVDVQITPTKWALMLQKLRKKEFDACMLGWGADWKQDPFQLWHSSQADVPESSNAGAYQNPEVDKLIDELRVTLNPKKQVELYHKIHRIIFDDQPYTFLFADMQTAAYDARLQNIKHYRIRPAVDHREWVATTPRSFGK